jgi:hypothetical protein
MMYIRHEKITVRPSKRRKCKTHPLAERIAEMCMNMIRQELPDFRAHLELLKLSINNMSDKMLHRLPSPSETFYFLMHA